MGNLKEYFDKQLEQQRPKFNIFSALHNETDERRLHSRFMSYLLCPNSGHGMGNSFLKLFLEKVLSMSQYRPNADNYQVIPNESNKTEYQNIDIFIYNDNDAIIIENKIYAGDSNHKSEIEDVFPKGYEGQLQRYHRIITDGKDHKGKEVYKRNVLQVVYLTLDGHPPSPESLTDVPLEKFKTIEYTTDIQNWLTDCIIEASNENPLLSQIINQYKELVIKLTSDLKKARENQEIISDNIDEAWGLENRNSPEERYFTKTISGIFNHVKWHTIDDFFSELGDALKENGATVIQRPDIKEITKVAHNEGRSKEKLVIRFRWKDIELYIANDSRGFTMGNLTTGKWDHFSEEVEGIKIKEIKFNDFSNEHTFYTINEEKRKETIVKMVDEVMRSYDGLKQDIVKVKRLKL